MDALLIIDMQKYFYNMAPDVFDKKIIPNLRNKIGLFQNSGNHIFHIKTVYSKDKSDWPEIRKKDNKIWCIQGTGDEKFIPGFEPQTNDIEITKKRYSAFFQTELENYLRELKIERVFLSGFSSDVCIRMTAIDAYNYGFKVVLLKKCMHSLREDFNESIEYLKWVSKAETD